MTSPAAARNTLVPLVVLALHAFAPSASATEGYWKYLDWLRVPEGIRADHVIVYDPGTNRVILYGGWWDDTPLDRYYGETWELTPDPEPIWREVAAGSSPPARAYASAIWDAAGNRMILYGGWNGSQTLGEVWEFSREGSPHWTLISAQGWAPPRRFGHTAIYDATRRRMIVFGGSDGSCFLSDVWSLSLEGTPTWTQLHPPGSTPLARYGHIAVYDGARDRMLVVGGYAGTCFVGAVGYQNDVWRLPLSGTEPWSQVPTSGDVPSPRAFHAAWIDPTTDQVMVTGGEGGVYSYPLSPDVYALPLEGTAAWALTPSPWHNGFSHGSAVVQTSSNRVLFTAGRSSQVNTFEMHLSPMSSWNDITPERLYPTDARRGVVYDPLRDGVIQTQPCNDGTYLLRLTGEQPWEDLGNAPSGSCVQGALVVRDSRRNRLLFMSQGGSGDPYSMDLNSLAWQTGNSPPPYPFLGASFAAYDSTRDRLYVCIFSKGETWYQDQSTKLWARTFPAGVPPYPRQDARGVYDPVNDRILLHGGRINDQPTDELWAWNLSGGESWEQLSLPAPAPSPRYAHSLLYDPVMHRVILYGGRDEQVIFGDLWQLSLTGTPAWSPAEVAGIVGGRPLVPRWNHSVTYDPVRRQMVLFGGVQKIYPLTQALEMWTLQLDVSTPTLATLLESSAESDRVRLRWWVPDSPGSAVQVQRRVPTEVWATVATMSVDEQGTITFEDVAVVPGATYEYRLYSADGVAGEVSITVPGRSGVAPLTVTSVHPNPARSDFTVEFSLPRRGATRLEIRSVDGRILDSRDCGTLEAGPHRWEWFEAQQIPPGLYFVRLLQGEQVAARKLIRL